MGRRDQRVLYCTVCGGHAMVLMSTSSLSRSASCESELSLCMAVLDNVRSLVSVGSVIGFTCSTCPCLDVVKDKLGALETVREGKFGLRGPRARVAWCL